MWEAVFSNSLSKRVAVFAALLFCATAVCAAPTNIILIIGDGMGLAHVSAARHGSERFAFDKFKHLGLVTTHSADDALTDSAAGATAFATGVKTNNNVVGMSADGKPLKTLFEYAAEKNMARGLVVTSRVTHATPAAFFSHVPHRRQESDIARDLVSSGVDVVIGGGRDMFVPGGFLTGSKRDDELDLLAQARKTHQIYADLNVLRANKSMKYLALLEEEALPRAATRTYSLGELTQLAISTLSKSPHGFVLLIEGSQIDWAAHQNDGEGVITETRDLESAVDVATKFAQSDSRTLVVVTADHETGGLSLSNRNSGRNLDLRFSTRGHTGEMVPIFAYGAFAHLFTGIQDNTDVGAKLVNIVTGLVE